jgi:hypothetical protein
MRSFATIVDSKMSNFPKKAIKNDTLKTVRLKGVPFYAKDVRKSNPRLDFLEDQWLDNAKSHVYTHPKTGTNIYLLGYLPFSQKSQDQLFELADTCSKPSLATWQSSQDLKVYASFLRDFYRKCPDPHLFVEYALQNQDQFEKLGISTKDYFPMCILGRPYMADVLLWDNKFEQDLLNVYPLKNVTVRSSNGSLTDSIGDFVDKSLSGLFLSQLKNNGLMKPTETRIRNEGLMEVLKRNQQISGPLSDQDERNLSRTMQWIQDSMKIYSPVETALMAKLFKRYQPYKSMNILRGTISDVFNRLETASLKAKESGSESIIACIPRIIEAALRREFLSEWNQ